MADEVRITGLKELNRALSKVNKEAAKTVRDAIKEAAEPVRVRAEQLAVSSISNVGPPWSQMRVGSTASTVYVAPKARRRGGSPRPNLGRLLFTQMQTALDQEQGEVLTGVERALDKLGQRAGF